MPNRTFTKTLPGIGFGDIEGIIAHARAYGIAIVSAAYDEATKTWTVTVNGTNQLMSQFYTEQGTHLGIV